ncbi:hypothetical protein [Methylobacterium sp. JK268]
METTWTYPVELRWEGGAFHAYSSGVPAAIASGPTVEAALDEMAKAFTALVLSRMSRGLDLFPPGIAADRETYRVPLPARLAAKASVYALWHRSGLSKTALGERLGRSETEVRRILDPRYGTKLDQIEEAVRALGGRMTVGFEAA